MSLGSYSTFPVPPIPKYIFSVIIGLILLGSGGPPIFIQGLLVLTKAIKENKI